MLTSFTAGQIQRALEEFQHLHVWRATSWLTSHKIWLFAEEEVCFRAPPANSMNKHFNVSHLILPSFWTTTRKELDLLQKLYGLYDAVMSKIGGYYKTLWTAVDTDIINNELLDFQNRCKKYWYTVDWQWKYNPPVVKFGQLNIPVI